jgi:Sigma-70 region 2
MKKTNRFQSAAAILPQGAAPERLSPVTHHYFDDVARRALDGDRDAIEKLAREFRAEMVDHASAHLGRFDCDAEDVVQDIFLAMLERTIRRAPKRASAVAWLLGLIASKARGFR